MEKETVICTCGHENPFGTKLCEKCGNPLTEEEKNTKVVDMRYDGKAIRSKTYNKSFVDKVWNFFSSVKVGITLIVILLLAASIGTFLPQEMYVNAGSPIADKGAYYESVYGFFGKIYYMLGLTDLYSSWWFQILVGMLGISIIVASIDRGIPLHKSLKNQRVKRHASFMKRQRVIASGEVADGETMLNDIEKQLKAQKFKVRRDGTALLAEKNRISRYGPYINHVGLIIFLVGVSLRVVPGFYVDESMMVKEGEMVEVPGMPGYYFKNEKFILETHDNNGQLSGEQEKQGVNVVAKNFQTNAKLYKQPEGAVSGDTSELELVKEAEIRVNHPLQYDGYSIYQMDYRLGDLSGMTFKLMNKATEESYGELTIDLTNPSKMYDLGNGSSVEILTYLPDYDGFKDGQPVTKSPNPNNPAFIFMMKTPETPEGETSFVEIKNTIEPLGENQNMMKFVAPQTSNASGLTINKNSTLPILSVGGIIFLLGVAIGSYWNHRRIWVQITDNQLLLATHTNKNWHGMKRELDKLSEHVALPAYEDQLALTDSEDEEEGDQ